MPGPPPKDPRIRARRNKAATSATLPAGGRPGPAPPLPDRDCSECAGEGGDCAACRGTGVKPWHPFVVKWWADVWASPMAVEFLPADVHGLFVLAELRDQFWIGERELAGEIRLQEQRFGLSSLDRRRLQWEVERAEQAQRRRPKSPVRAGRRPIDPRRNLRVVK